MPNLRWLSLGLNTYSNDRLQVICSSVGRYWLCSPSGYRNTPSERIHNTCLEKVQAKILSYCFLSLRTFSILCNMDTYYYRPQRPVISMVWSPRLQLGKQALFIHTVGRASGPLLVIGQWQRGLDAMKQTSLFCSEQRLESLGLCR